MYTEKICSKCGISRDVDLFVKNKSSYDGLRSRICNAIKFGYGNKAFRTSELIGCSVDKVKIHIESLWREGMTWENHGRGKGKWHIDHIKPCDAFDMNNVNEQKICFHYTNLQPLWQEDNVAKKNKWEGC